jgi:hypothetical protein
MVDELTYKIAKCCTPEEDNQIIGYFKEDGTITVHGSSCSAVPSLRTERLLDVSWDEIHKSKIPDTSQDIPSEVAELDETDYFILKHHQELGMDYSKVVAETLRIPLEEMQQRHRKLRELGGLKRVERRIIHYRKNIVKGKWIKHRNHTYYDLTPEGNQWINALERLSSNQD